MFLGIGQFGDRVGLVAYSREEEEKQSQGEAMCLLQETDAECQMDRNW